MKTTLFSRRLLLCAVFAVSAMYAQTTFNEIHKSVSSDRATGDKFGYSVSVSGDFAVIGAPYESENAVGGGTAAESGSAYIFQRNSSTGIWSQIQKIVASDRTQLDHFGWSVSISGNYLIVGAPDEDNDAAGGNNMFSSGSAYIFERNTSTGVWSEVIKIVASDRAAGDIFAWSVSISGTNAVVGAPAQDNGGTTNAGAAYVFTRTSGVWTFINKCTASDMAANDNFGYSVSISGLEFIAGAPNEDENAVGSATLSNAGSAYIFRKVGSTWTQQQKLVAGDRAIGDNFGFSVCMFTSKSIVGAPQQDLNASGSGSITDAGAAYIFHKGTTWTQFQKIVASDRAASDHFGYSVAMTSNDAIVGAPDEDENATGTSTLSAAGSMYVYNIIATGSWNQTQKKVASDRAAGDNYGFSVAIINTRIVVGAPNEDEDVAGLNTYASAGSVYFLEGCPYPSTGFSIGPVFACAGDDIVITEIYTGASTYQWQINTGSGFVNVVDNDMYSGSTTASLSITDVQYCMDGYVYRCIITASCGASIIAQDHALALTAVDFNETGKIVAAAPNRTAGDFFGYSVSISNSYAIVGSNNDSQNSAGGAVLNQSGSAYIYERDAFGTWIEVAKITAPNRAIGDQFGWSVAMYGDYVVIGAPFEDEDASESNTVNQAGSAYIFKRISGVWTFLQKIVAPVRAVSDQFGWSVSISGDHIIVGANLEDEDASGLNTLASAGAAYIYTYNSGTGLWNPTPQKVVPSDRAAGDGFGGDVAIDGNYAVVSAPYDDKNASGTGSTLNRGSAYIFERNISTGVWSQTTKLSGEAFANDNFGISVAIYGKTVAIGTPYNGYDASGGGTHIDNSGAVYIYNLNSGSWTFTQKLVAPIRYLHGYFGRDVSISGSYLIAGCNHNNLNDGGGYIFELCTPTWTLIEEIFSSDLVSGDDFGGAVDIAGGYMILSSIGDDASAGSAYIFESCMAPSIRIGESSDDGENSTNALIGNNEVIDLKCYPNPALDNLNVSIIGDQWNNGNLSMLDMNGKVVMNILTSNNLNLLNIQDLTPGIYLIQFQYDGGIITRKFIKQ